MNLSAALSYIYSTIERHVVCKPDAIADLCGVLDRLHAASAMMICGPTILQHANVVQRVQSVLGQRCVGLFAGVLPHAPVEMFEDAIRMARDLQPEDLGVHALHRGRARGLRQGPLDGVGSGRPHPRLCHTLHAAGYGRISRI